MILNPKSLKIDSFPPLKCIKCDKCIVFQRSLLLFNLAFDKYLFNCNPLRICQIFSIMLLNTFLLILIRISSALQCHECIGEKSNITNPRLYEKLQYWFGLFWGLGNWNLNEHEVSQLFLTLNMMEETHLIFHKALSSALIFHCKFKLPNHPIRSREQNCSSHLLK